MREPLAKRYRAEFCAAIEEAGQVRIRSVTLKSSIEDKSIFSNEEHPENNSAIEVTFEESNRVKFTSTSDEQPLNIRFIVVASEVSSPEKSALVRFIAPLIISFSE